jgi:Predicted metal-dependent phosphoesterases (PHP family)
MRFDLHVHSNCSDGRDDVRTILRAAARRDLDGLSITDHDTLRGSQQAMKIIREDKLDLILIPGQRSQPQKAICWSWALRICLPEGSARRRPQTWLASREGSL